MRYNLYEIKKDEKILAPLKCGTRYLDECIEDETLKSHMNSNQLKSLLFDNKIKWIIVRPPQEHLFSAIYTELNGYLGNNIENHTNIDGIKDVLNQFITFKNSKSNEVNQQNVHWSKDCHKDLYFYWKRNRKFVNIVELKDLSKLLKDLKIKTKKYNPDNYKFKHNKYWWDKDDLLLYIKETFTSEWIDYLKQIELADVWYNRLINKEMIDIKLI